MYNGDNNKELKEIKIKIYFHYNNYIFKSKYYNSFLKMLFLQKKKTS